MTNSLYQNIQALGNRMVTNLGKMGVSAEFADGGLTLADKILEINRFTDGLLLSVDKDIAQSSNTMNFTAVYLQNGNVVSGKSVNFYGLKSATSTSKSLTANTWTPVGCKFGVSVDSSVAGMLALTKDSTPVSIIAAEGVLIVNIPNKSPYSNVSNIVFEDGILSFTYNGSTVTEDLSSYDCTNVNASVSGFTIADYGVFDTTDSNGVATAQYTCSGAGKFDVQAISGSVVSQPYEVWDCVKYDTGIDGTATNIYDTLNANSQLTRTSEYSKLTEVNAGTTATLSVHNIPNGCVVDLEFCQADGLVSEQDFSIAEGTSYRTSFSLSSMGFTSSAIGEWKKLRIDLRTSGYVTITDLEDNTKTYTNPNIFTGQGNRVNLLTNNTTTEIRIRNVKVYPL